MTNLITIVGLICLILLIISLLAQLVLDSKEILKNLKKK